MLHATKAQVIHFNRFEPRLSFEERAWVAHAGDEVQCTSSTAEVGESGDETKSCMNRLYCLRRLIQLH